MFANLFAINLSISSLFLRVKLIYIIFLITLQELIEGYIKNCSFLLRDKYIGLLISGSTLFVYPVNYT